MLSDHCRSSNPFMPFAPSVKEANLLEPTQPTILLVDPAGRCGAVEAAASFMGALCKTVSSEWLFDRQAAAADLLWVRVSEDMDNCALIRAICAWVEIEQVATVLHCSIDRLDALDAGLGDKSLVSFILDDDVGQVMAMLASRLRPSSGGVRSPSAITEIRDRQIETLKDEVDRISRMLSRLAIDSASQGSPSPFSDNRVSAARRAFCARPASADVVPPVSARDVRQIIRQRRLRDEFFDGQLFSDPAWDMLLDLYAARLDQAPVSVSSLCIAAAVPATTALRWIKTLTETKLFERRADQYDARRFFVQLSDDASEAMHRYFARLADPPLLS